MKKVFSAILLIICCGSAFALIKAVYTDIKSEQATLVNQDSKFNDWQPVLKITPSISPTESLPVITFERSKIQKQSIPNINGRNGKIVSYWSVKGIRLTFHTKRLFGNGTYHQEKVNGIDRDDQIDLMINIMRNDQLFIKDPEPVIQLYDNFIVVEVIDDMARTDKQISWLLAQLSSRFKTKFVEK